MPDAGLSLVGFMAQPQAIHHLATECVPINKDPAVLRTEWVAAQATLGTAISNAGQPDVQPLPAAAQAHIDQLKQAPWAVPYLTPLVAQGATFNLVGIDELLAFQHTVNTNHSAGHCAGLNNPSALDLLPICLPLAEKPLDFIHSTVDTQSKSVILMTRDTNVDMRHWGIFDTTPPAGQPGQASRLAGAQIVTRYPFVEVVRFNGRCYLHNGLHRVYGTRRAGATHVPCIFRDVQSAADVGLGANTFALPLLESGNPPTVGHFTQGRAHAVRLRTTQRIIHVTWAEYTIPVE